MPDAEQKHQSGSLKCSQSISHVTVKQKTHISEIGSVSDMLVFFSAIMCLIS
jgi:hypothetical protein